jgi:hypothetical protein
LLRQTAKRKQSTTEEKPVESPAKPILMVDAAAKVREGRLPFRTASLLTRAASRNADQL